MKRGLNSKIIIMDLERSARYHVLSERIIDRGTDDNDVIYGMPAFPGPSK